MAGRDWSREEVEATVASYFQMLELELRGEAYSKTEHRRGLQRLLDQRSEGAIEYKFRNVSAVLIELGRPYIEGYKPARNYQELLRGVVADRLAEAAELERLVQAAVERPVEVPSVEDILSVLVDPPRGVGASRKRFSREPAPRYGGVNYLKREAENTRLGRAGEEFVLNFERARLISERQEPLAARVEHVAMTRGDHEGFDVLSFERGGTERLIEVKTTGFGKETPFFVSPNQVDVSRRETGRYHLYRLFRFRRDPKLFTVRGRLDEVCVLDATEFLGVVR